MKRTRISRLVGTGLLLTAAYVGYGAEADAPTAAMPLPASIKGTFLHVAPTGDDASPGTCEQPFATQKDYAGRMRWKAWT